ncbi:hypothetical protein WJX81_002033 [Elliptochloris bilobata]|uniref:amino-acid N-acetyltransferase n=1 Tax=Elliptochloris bilobata TaxID=381761 RepID=A0AAW1RSZ2_9CHLO
MTSVAADGLRPDDFDSFVHFFRQASPYIEGHRGRTFVICCPGEVVEDSAILHSLLEDVALLHGLGIKLVLALGVRAQINRRLHECGVEPRYKHGKRVTDTQAMQAAAAAAAAVRMEVEARLSRGPAVQVVRRHARSSDAFRYAPAMTTVSGNYVAARRMGIVDGVDFGLTGMVRWVQADAIQSQLDSHNIVLLSNIGYSAAGEALNCDIWSIAVRAAIDLAADKLFCLTVPESQPFSLPVWVPVSDAEALLNRLVVQHQSFDDFPASVVPHRAPGAAAPPTGNGAHRAAAGDELDLERWQRFGLPVPLVAACTACEMGVKRAHLVDARRDGALLLELYSRDGIGTMISRDFYEGMRRADPADLAAVAELLAPLEAEGVLAPRSHAQLEGDLPFFVVAEREAKILGCAMMRPLGTGSDGRTVAEIGAFCVAPACRGSGKGDSLLDYLEREARAAGMGRLVLLTTRTADWFEARGFRSAGLAHESPLLPAERRERVNAARNSQLFVKDVGLDEVGSGPSSAGHDRLAGAAC